MVYPTEYTELQWLLSGVHSIMMVKSAQPGGGGCTPAPFHSICHRGYKEMSSILADPRPSTYMSLNVKTVKIFISDILSNIKTK